ncbi:hypothetical protein HDU76_001885 [Blyttiomyces sp. JEL0837]|nr:hypothetical protein HDU76_001885 [Blyttiomyces sp. JEL0837]
MGSCNSKPADSFDVPAGTPKSAPTQLTENPPALPQAICFSLNESGIEESCVRELGRYTKPVTPASTVIHNVTEEKLTAKKEALQVTKLIRQQRLLKNQLDELTQTHKMELRRAEVDKNGLEQIIRTMEKDMIRLRSGKPDIDDERSERRRLQEDLRDCQNQLQQKEAYIQRLNATINEVHEEVQSARTRLLKEEESFTLKEEALEESQAAVQQLQEQINRTRTIYLNLKRVETDLRTESTNLRTEFDLQAKKLSRKVKRIDGYEHRGVSDDVLGGIMRRIVWLEGDKLINDQETARLREQNRALSHNVEQTEEVLKSTLSQFDITITKLNDRENQCSALVRELKELIRKASEEKVSNEKTRYKNVMKGLNDIVRRQE